MNRKTVLLGATTLLIQLLPFVLAIASPAGGPSTDAVVSNDRLATCYDEKSGRFRGPMLVRSQVLVAPDGEHRAYVESLAEGDLKLPSKTGDGWLSPECATITHIFVSDGPLRRFRPVLTFAPSEDMLGNAVNVVDWSPDNRYLLLEAVLFQWGSDFGDSDPVIYDAGTNVFSSPDLIYKSFKRRTGRDCVVLIKALGFSADGKVVLRAGPYQAAAPESAEPEPNSCLKRPGTWLYDIEDVSLTESATSQPVKHFGRFEGRK